MRRRTEIVSTPREALARARHQLVCELLSLPTTRTGSATLLLLLMTVDEINRIADEAAASHPEAMKFAADHFRAELAALDRSLAATDDGARAHLSQLRARLAR
ncbi:hypothetical protein [Leifsonia aquatica]|uniref:hypothetical protein n=1 Tax=Leifsonia aquatica TaxID=144185 RepID=UPI0028A5B1E0|nr:hypothetical protein [Leifsonia aquatica]